MGGGAPNEFAVSLCYLLDEVVYMLVCLTVRCQPERYVRK